MNRARRRSPPPARLLLAASPPRPGQPGVRRAAARRAADQIYNLDHDLAIATFRQAVAADPQDAARLSRPGERPLAEHHLPPRQHDGRRLPRPGHAADRPAAAAAGGNRGGLSRRARSARWRSPAQRIAANPRDADAHYQLGAAVGLRASYTATVEGSVLGAFRAAREAYDEHETVLDLDPSRKDAGLIVGTYRYIVRGAGAAAALGGLRRRLRRRQRTRGST